MQKFILIALDTTESIIAAVGILIAGIVGAGAAALVKVRKAASEDKREDVKLDVNMKVTTFDQMQVIVRQLTARVEAQDVKIDAKDARITEITEEMADCHAERAELVERVKWLERNAGKPIGDTK